MPDYSKGKIYCIRSFQTDDVYIGSTTMTLAQRLGKHRDDYKKYLNGNKKYVSSFELLKYDDYYIELITLYPCSCKAELDAEEGQYHRDWDCVNKKIAGRTKKQYYIDNKDKIIEKQKQYIIDNKYKIKEQKKQYNIDNRDKFKEYKKQYYIDNRDKIIEKNNQYRINNKQNKQKITCICSCNISRHSYKRHIKSKKHKKLMSEFIQNFISQ
jgi:hypothetical protein